MKITIFWIGDTSSFMVVFFLLSSVGFRQYKSKTHELTIWYSKKACESQDAEVPVWMTNYCTFWGEDGGNPELTSFLGEDLHSKARWWFQIWFMFIPIWKNDPITQMGGKKSATRNCLATNSAGRCFFVEKPFPSGCTRFGGHGWLVSQLKI